MSGRTSSSDDLTNRVKRRLIEQIIGKPIIGNAMRGLYVEAMIAEILGSDWDYVGSDWASWDFEHGELWHTLEIKQSAARQPWSDNYAGRISPASFDIKKRSGYWYSLTNQSVPEWHSEICRPADIYVFCWHPRRDKGADQRLPDDWQFFLIREEDLPAKQVTIGLEGVMMLSDGAVQLNELSDRILKIVGTIPYPRQRRK